MEGELENEITCGVPNEEEAIEDVQGDDGEFISCILEKVLLAPRQRVGTQRHAIFRTRCTISGKVYELLIDSGCTKNISP